MGHTVSGTRQSSDSEEVVAAAFSDFVEDLESEFLEDLESEDFESEDLGSDDFESDDFESDDFESGDDSELEPLDAALPSVA